MSSNRAVPSNILASLSFFKAISKFFSITSHNSSIFSSGCSYFIISLNCKRSFKSTSCVISKEDRNSSSIFLYTIAISKSAVRLDSFFSLLKETFISIDPLEKFSLIFFLIFDSISINFLGSRTERSKNLLFTERVSMTHTISPSFISDRL